MRKLEYLTDTLREKATRLIQLCNERGIIILITCTARTPLEQEALYAQGREKLVVVNEKRKAAGLYLITENENHKVTWTMLSKHLADISKGERSKAFDFVVMKEGKEIWDIKADVNANEVPDYFEVGQIGKALGLIWGGDWNTPDYPHFQEA